MKLIRLDKYISDAEAITRSQAKQAIKKGKVHVEGRAERKPETKIDPACVRVTLDGHPCIYEEYLYLMLNKPQGVVSATEDAEEKTVLDCVDTQGHSLFPVGRLDKDTEGLLLLTDDGKLAHDLLSPKKHVKKSYYALLDKELGEEAIQAVREGLDIGDEKKTLPAELELLGLVDEELSGSCNQKYTAAVGQKEPEPAGQKEPEPAGQKEPEPAGQKKSEYANKVYAVRFVITEGRYHQVKRMARALGAEVLYLKRETMGSLRLDPKLQPGEYRRLTGEELAGLCDAPQATSDGNCDSN